MRQGYKGRTRAPEKREATTICGSQISIVSANLGGIQKASHQTLVRVSSALFDLRERNCFSERLLDGEL
ncbi:MAG: hypothetical protein RLZZ399_1031 [Verrucomicrobiota bacterium]|jgi:hypothetical protein